MVCTEYPDRRKIKVMEGKAHVHTKGKSLWTCQKSLRMHKIG